MADEEAEALSLFGISKEVLLHFLPILFPIYIGDCLFERKDF